MKKPKKWGAEEKAKVALAALRGDQTIAEISSKYKVHSTQINRWKQQALEGLKNTFTPLKPGHDPNPELQELNDELFKEIGKLKVENEWLKKQSALFNS